MEAQSSHLDHLHLPQPHNGMEHHSDGSSHTSLPFTRAANTHQGANTVLSAAWSQDEVNKDVNGKSWKTTDSGGDVEMGYGDSESEGDVDEVMDADSPKEVAEDEEESSFVAAPLPLPDFKQENPTSSQRSRRQYSERDRRAQGVNPPRLSVSLQNDKTADYKPWMGDSSEDILNETIIRNGYSDKPANAGQSESNMARPIIWSNLKNKHGLLALSTLFIQTMDKRQALGKCTTRSNFKPPPRVTLPELKREAWLRDLASNDVPLRRLSRTIPHGVRNKTLLDQCLSKKIPLARAIWLVKCVGANEIRGFRRKGINGTINLSGELKWIREWTVCVAQFLDSTIRECGQKDWSTQIRYVIRLATALVEEDLLDREHFLSFIVTSFASSTPDMLPLWTLLVQICWRHLVAAQGRGRQLGEAVLQQLEVLQKRSSSAALKPLMTSLDRLLARLVVSHTGCLVGLKRWNMLAANIKAVQSRQSHQNLHQHFEIVKLRNNRLTVSSDLTRARLKTPRLLLFDYLDRTRFDTSFESIFNTVRTICPDTDVLVEGLVDWASTTYRTGMCRVYLVIRMLRQLANTGSNLEQAVLSSLASSSHTNNNQDLYNKIIIELVQSGHFNFGKYLQWLISSGSLSWAASSHASLLFSIPPSQLTAQNLSLRHAIVGRLGPTAETGDEFESFKDEFESRLEEESQTWNDFATMVEEAAKSPSSTRLSLSQWITQRFTTTGATTTGATTTKKRPLAASTEIFLAVRAIIENAADFSSLYQVLRHLIPSSTAQDATNYAATVQRHADIFNAMGVLQELVVLLYRVHARLRQSNQLHKSFICSLLELIRTQHRMSSQVPTLEQDLTVCEQQHAAAVCSPASDSMITAQPGDIGSDHDIDRILASGNMMDEHLLARLFSAIVERTVKWTVAGASSLANPCRWFASLRMFDMTTFDRHMNNLLGKLVANAGTDQVRAILIALVSSGCLNPANALNAFVKRLELLETNSAPQIARFSAGTLQTFLPLTDLDHQRSQPDIYRFQIAQAIVCKQHFKTILRFVWHSLGIMNEANNCIFSDAGIAWLSKCCISDSEAVAKSLHVHERIAAPKGPRVSKILWMMSKGISSGNDRLAAEAEDMSGLARMIQGSDELRLPFIRLVLGHMGGATASPEQRTELRQAFEAAIDEHSAVWPQLMDGAGSEVARSLHQYSCNSILQAVSELLIDQDAESAKAAVVENLKVAAITANDNDDSTLPLLDRIVDLLQQASERLDEAQDRKQDADRALNSITSLVQLIILSTSSLATEKATSPTIQHLLGVLCTLAARGNLQMYDQVTELLHDCCALLSRDLSTDQLSSIYRRLEDPARQDQWVRFMLGIEDSGSKWLSLASRVAMQPLATNSPTPAQSSFQSLARSGQQSMPSPRPLGSVADQSNNSTPLPSPGGQLTATPARATGPITDIKYAPYMLRKWEVMQDATPNMGKNDTSLSLQLFAARKVL